MNWEFNRPIRCLINLARSRLSWILSVILGKSIRVWGMQGPHIFKSIMMVYALSSLPIPAMNL